MVKPAGFDGADEFGERGIEASRASSTIERWSRSGVVESPSSMLLLY
jgi:hypothetical protein